MRKTIVIIGALGLFCATAWSQCGPLVMNPVTGKLDCTGPASAGDGTVTSSGTPAVHQVPIFISDVDIKGLILAANAILTGVNAADPAGKSISDLMVTNYVAGGGNAQAQTATLAPAATALAAGLLVRWMPAAANTAGVPTLAVNGLTATAITKCGATAVVANDLTTTAVAWAVYDGTQFQLLNPMAVPCGKPGTAGVADSATGNAGSVTNGLYTTTPAGTLGAAFHCADAGANDSYACDLSPAITSYTTGQTYWFKANTANTGAATLTLNSIAGGAIPIKKVAGGITTVLADNDIRAGQWVAVLYDGTNMQMASDLGNAAAAGITVMTTGAGAPSAACAVPSASNLAMYWDSTAKNMYYCSATTPTWQKFLSDGAGQGKTGATQWAGTTSGGAGFTVNDVAGTSILYILPAANGSAGQVMYDTGAATCPTLKTAPTSCHQLAWTDSIGGTKTANYVFAGPATGAAAAGAFRALVSADIPANAANTSGTAAGLSATLAIAGGGTAQTSVPGSSGNYIYNNSGAYGAKAITQTHAIGCAVGDPAGSALATGVLCYVTAPVACTIQSWDILVDSGTATLGIWKVATGTAIPTVSNSIVASAAPAISTGTAIHSATMTGWTTAVDQYDIFGFNLTTTSGPKYVYVGVNCNETK